MAAAFQFDFLNLIGIALDHLSPEWVTYNYSKCEPGAQVNQAASLQAQRLIEEIKKVSFQRNDQ